MDNYGAAIAGYVVEYGDLVYGSTGFTGLYSDSSTVNLVGVPDPPTGVTATPGQEQATITFSAPANNGGAAIDGYRITVSPGGTTVSCGASPCDVTGLTAGTTYTFGVEAHNTYGYSSSASASTTPGIAPGTPAGMSSTVVVGQAYSDSVSATGYPSPTFSVTGGALPDGLALNAGTGAITGSPTSTGAWSVTITATNTYGTAAATFSGSAGQVPVINTASLGTLTWGTPVDFYLSVDGVPTPSLSVTAGTMPSGLTLDTDGRVHGTPDAVGAYSVGVTATNTYGTDARTYAGSVAAATPSEPTIVSITAGNGFLEVNFTPPSADGGDPITTYQYSLDGGTTWLPRSGGTTESPLVITGLTNGVTYSVMVLGVNGVGSGAASAASTGRPHEATLAATGASIVPGWLALTFILSGAGLIAIARRRERAWSARPA